MPATSEKATILTNKMRVPPRCNIAFGEWQAKFNKIIAAASGFVSLEILSPAQTSTSEWMITQRFKTADNVIAWKNSKERDILFNDLRSFLNREEFSEIQENEVKESELLKGVVTEVFISEINPGQELAYFDWMSKIHQVEEKFPGFRGVYIQAPNSGRGKNWITLLQFDKLENLDHWLTSPERQKVLKELKPLINSIESHRVISPYAGWFSSLANQGELPPVWKQTMIVLLVLFPIVMLEIRFLMPFIAHLGLSLSTFIGNAISVTLIAWPMMPIAIRFLKWWLSPQSSLTRTVSGFFVVAALYLIEIIVL